VFDPSPQPNARNIRFHATPIPFKTSLPKKEKEKEKEITNLEGQRKSPPINPATPFFTNQKPNPNFTTTTLVQASSTPPFLPVTLLSHSSKLII
jgi:hypothetical protein